MIDKGKIITEFVNNFIQKDKTERTIFELSESKKRHKFINRLNHRWDAILKMKLLTEISVLNDDSDTIQELLKFGSDDLCYVISNYGEYDDKILPFGVVFNKIYAAGLATLLVNISANTIFLETEQEKGRPPRFIGRK